MRRRGLRYLDKLPEPQGSMPDPVKSQRSVVVASLDDFLATIETVCRDMVTKMGLA